MTRILCADELAFMRTIHDDPADDLPRLVFADWLQETGVPLQMARAELIRSQILVAAGDHPDIEDHRRNCRRLLHLHTIAWWHDWPQIEGVVWGWPDRGFPEHAIVTNRAYELHFAAIFDLLPIVSLRLNSSPLTDLDRLLARGVSPTLRKLSLGGYIRVPGSMYETAHGPTAAVREQLIGVRRMIELGLHRQLSELTIDGLRHYSSEARELLYANFPPRVLERH